MTHISQMKFKLVRVTDSARAYWIDGIERTASDAAMLGWDNPANGEARFEKTEIGDEIKDDDGDVWERVE